jgi:hypothetical protein
MSATATRPKHAPRYSTAANLVLVCVSMLVSIAGAELFLRRFEAGKPFSTGWAGEFKSRSGPDFIADEFTGWRMRPSHDFVWVTEGTPHNYHANAQGFRADADFTTDGSKKRIVLAGDSYTFGSGSDYQDSFGAVVERKSSNRTVYNLGMPGFGVDQVWMSVRHQGLALKPDLIVVGVVDADFERSLVPHAMGGTGAKPAFKLMNGRLVLRTHEQPPGPLLHFLERNSSILAVARHIPRWVGRKYPIGNYFELNRAILTALLEDCKQVPVLFIYIPTKEFRPFPALARFMRSIGANYIDLTEIRPVPPHSIYLPKDGHLSMEGNRYVAGLIDEWIRGHMQWY